MTVLISGSGNQRARAARVATWSRRDQRAWNRLTPAQRRAQTRNFNQMERENAEQAETDRLLAPGRNRRTPGGGGGNRRPRQPRPR